MSRTPPRPTIAAPPPWAFGEPDEERLDNGLRVLVLPRPGQLILSATLVVDLPLVAEPGDIEGVAALTARTLSEGTATHPGPRFFEVVEDHGAVLDAGVGYSHTQVALDVPRSQLGAALRLLAEAVAEPQLTDADAERQRAVLLAGIAQQRASSAPRANDAIRAALIDPGHRACRPTTGEPATVEAVTGDDLRAFHERYYGPAGATLVLAGDLGEDAIAEVEAALGSWLAPGQLRLSHAAPAPREGGAWILHRPGSVQADIRRGWFTIDRAHPSWADLQIAGHALGGAHLSRLNRVLREERGYTYGAGLATVPLRAGGYTYAHGSFRPDVAPEVLALLPTLLDVEAAPLTPAEITRACDYLVGVSPLRYATAAGACDGLVSLVAAGLPPRTIDDHLAALRRVTPESATHTVTSLLRPDVGSLVVVGDAEVLEAPVRAAGWEPTVIPATESF